MAVRALRGATTVDRDSVTDIKDRTVELVLALLERNGLDEDHLISILFSTTPDLTAVPPAVGLREVGFGEVPLLCVAEMPTDGGLDRCIRILVHVECDHPRSRLRHVFLRGATVLRPDLAEDGDHLGWQRSR
jgi:chorismate mutase